MLIFFTILGILILIGALALLIIPIIDDDDTFNLRRFKVLSLVLIPVGLFCSLSSGIFFYATPGHQYYIIYPTGGETAVMKSGYRMKWFGKVQEWEQYIDIKTVAHKKKTKRGDEDKVNHIGGMIYDGINVRFIDQVRGRVFINVRIKIPADPENFISIVKKYRHPENLINNTLIPTIRQTVNISAYMYKAQNYISGDASGFRSTIQDQLKNGDYRVRRVEIVDSVISKIESNNRIIKEPQIHYDVEKIIDPETGKPARDLHDIAKNNIIVAQVNVTDVDLEEKFKIKLEEQRDLVSKRRIDLQKIENAEIDQKRIIAEGERDKAAERVAQEKKQVKELIAIETKLKKEETNKKLAEIQLETEKLNSQKVKVKAEAESRKNSLLVRAGLTPQERAQIEKEIAIGVAAEIAKLKLPEVYINGNSSSKGGGVLYDILGADYARKMTKGLSK